MTGKLIVFEGLDGVGKTTQRDMLVDELDHEHRVHATSEPGNGPIGKLLRDIGSGDLKVPREAQVLLYAAERAARVEADIGMRAGGTHVIQDRSFWSSLAYGSALGINLEWLETVNDFSLRRAFPDLTIFLTMDPSESLGRVDRRGKRSIYEDLDFQQVVGKQYRAAFSRHFTGGEDEAQLSIRARAMADTKYLAIIEASGQTPDEVHQMVMQALHATLSIP